MDELRTFPFAAGNRTFSLVDQKLFADLSGDYNPIHLDSVSARRTQAGDVVVHGVHTLLWSLDVLAPHLGTDVQLASLKVRFDELIYLNEPVKAVLTHQDEKGFRAEVMVGGATAVRMSATFGSAKSSIHMKDLPALEIYPEAQDLTLDQMADSCGCVPFVSTPEKYTESFPNVCALWGADRVAALGASTYVVGMASPGLHSVFGGLSVDAMEDDDWKNSLNFRVNSVDARFRLVRMTIDGPRLTGSVQCLARHAPTSQASALDAKSHVSAFEFTGTSVLIIGGSRGLGEITAKLLAAGGASVTITYAKGQTDAKRVRDEIRAAGGTSEILAYDVLEDASTQLANSSESFDTAYYFATPPIARRAEETYSRARFDTFMTYYVDGFYKLCQALTQRQHAAKISIFYPSTTFVHERPDKMTEYAMTKLAGEALCVDIVRHNRNLAITQNRIPRLKTDQTAGVASSDLGDPAEYMLAVIREVQSRRIL